MSLHLRSSASLVGRRRSTAASPSESVAVGARPARASAEAVAAQDVEDNINDSDNNLRNKGNEIHGRTLLPVGELTVTITETIVMMTFAMAEIIALIPPPIAETMEPCIERTSG